MLSASFISVAVHVYLLSFHVVAAFQIPRTHLSQRDIRRLSAVTSASIEKIPVKSSLLASFRNELGRTVNIIFNAPLERKAVVIAHPVVIVLIYLVAKSKFVRNLGKLVIDFFSNILLSMNSSIKNSQKASALAISLAKGKLEDRRSKPDKPSSNTDVRTSKSEAIINMPVKSVKDDNLFASAVIASKLADVEAQEIAYLKAQNLKKDAEAQVSLAKTQALEIEESRVLRIAKLSFVIDEFRKKHDIEFRRWNAEQYSSPGIRRRDVKAENEALIAAEQNLAVEALQRQHILSANLIEEARKKSEKDEETQRLLIKAAAEKDAIERENARKVLIMKEDAERFAAKAAAEKEAQIKENARKLTVKDEETKRLMAKAAAEKEAADIETARKLALKKEEAERIAAKAAALKATKDAELLYAAQLKEKSALAKAEKIKKAAAIAAERKKAEEDAAAAKKQKKDEAAANAKRKAQEQLAAMEKTQSLGWTPHYMMDE